MLTEQPENLDTRQRVGSSHYRLGITSGQQSAAAFAAGTIGDLAHRMKHYSESLKLRMELAETDPKDAQTQVELLLSHARLGHAKQVERIAERLLEQAGRDRQVLFQVACAYAILADGPDDADGFRNQAFFVLRKLSEIGWKDPVALETDPDMDSIRRDKRFREILK